MRHHGPRHRKTALVMVGLPARGKTYTARKVARYLRWLGYEAKVFNVGNYRRERLGAQQPHSFFDPANVQGFAARKEMAVAALSDMLDWFDQGGDVGIYDATNTTRERRGWVHDRLAAAGLDVVFIESICEDKALVEANIRETKLLSPDYAGADPEDAVRDFRARIAHYGAAYEPVDEPGYSWIKLIDVNRQVITNEIRGYLPGRLVFFLMNLHIVPRPIWLTRHGQSTYNLENRLGGDAGLSPAGEAYARSLRAFVAEYGEVAVWTSTLRRAVQTAEPLGGPGLRWRALDEISAGDFDGLTYEDLATRHPDDHAARVEDKLRYRYPRGESYEDVMARVEPVLLELERQRDPVLVIAHQAVLRALYGYFTSAPPEAIPHLDIPLHTVIALTPKAYGAQEERFVLPPAVRDVGSS